MCHEVSAHQPPQDLSGYRINKNVFAKWRNISNVHAVARKAFFQPLHKYMLLYLKSLIIKIKNN